MGLPLLPRSSPILRRPMTYVIGLTRHGLGIQQVEVLEAKYLQLVGYMTRMKMLGRANHVMWF